MTTMLAKLRRCGRLSLLLGVLLFGNELAHLCYHEHLHASFGEAAHSVCSRPDGASVSAAAPHRLTRACAGESFCPCCSSAIDWLCSPAPAEPQCEPPSVAVFRRDPTPPVFHFSPHHQPRSPPRG